MVVSRDEAFMQEMEGSECQKMQSCRGSTEEGEKIEGNYIVIIIVIIIVVIIIIIIVLYHPMVHSKGSTLILVTFHLPFRRQICSAIRDLIAL